MFGKMPKKGIGQDIEDKVLAWYNNLQKQVQDVAEDTEDEEDKKRKESLMKNAVSGIRG